MTYQPDPWGDEALDILYTSEGGSWRTIARAAARRAYQQVIDAVGPFVKLPGNPQEKARAVAMHDTILALAKKVKP